MQKCFYLFQFVILHRKWDCDEMPCLNMFEQLFVIETPINSQSGNVPDFLSIVQIFEVMRLKLISNSLMHAQ